MFSWLFGKKDQATRREDSVWMSDAARLKGIAREVDLAVKDGRCTVVVAWTLSAFDELVRELDPHKPLLCRDLFGFDALRARFAQAGSVTVALASVISSDANPPTSSAVEILICGRNSMRSADDIIVRFADVIGANARLTFHLSLEDALLKDYIGTIRQLLARLDVPNDEAISNPMVTRAIARAQAKKKS